MKPPVRMSQSAAFEVAKNSALSRRNLTMRFGQRFLDCHSAASILNHHGGPPAVGEAGYLPKSFNADGRADGNLPQRSTAGAATSHRTSAVRRAGRALSWLNWRGRGLCDKLAWRYDPTQREAAARTDHDNPIATLHHQPGQRLSGTSARVDRPTALAVDARYG